MKDFEDNSDTIQDTSKTFVSSVVGYFTSSSSCSDNNDALDEYPKDELSSSLSDKPYLDSEVLQFLNSTKVETVCRNDSETMIPTQDYSTRKKKRCAYLDYMLRLDAIGTPHSVSDTRSEDQDMVSGKKHSDNLILDAFIGFRKFLENLVEKYPCLAGETDVKAYSVPREWDNSMWENVLLEQDVSISILGVCDSVKCVAVLMALADILRDHLKSMKLIDSKTEHLSSLSPSIEVLDNKKLFRVLAWGFAALAGLDRLQAVDQDVSYTLQRVKRNCRALMCQERKEFGDKTYQSTYIVQLLIEKFYDQR